MLFRSPGIGPESEHGMAFDKAGRVRTDLAGMSVAFSAGSTLRAPIVYASPNQLNVVTPFGVLVGAQLRVTVKRDGVTTGSAEIYMFPTHPGIFSLDGSGGGQGAILNEDGKIGRAHV